MLNYRAIFIIYGMGSEAKSLFQVPAELLCDLCPGTGRAHHSRFIDSLSSSLNSSTYTRNIYEGFGNPAILAIHDPALSISW